MKILFVSRAYPPVVGGIENQNYELSQWLPQYAQTTTIANTKGKIALPVFLPWMLLRLLFTMPKYDVLLLGDGVLGILGWWVKKIFPKKKVACVIHGLDLTYLSSLYQILWVGTFLPACDQFIAVGNQTLQEAVHRGIPKERCVFIPNGIDPEKFLHFTGTKDDLSELVGPMRSDAQTILTTGRLAKRKGVAWFIRNVLPKLPAHMIYIVAGAGPDQENIEDAIAQTGLAERVILLGRVRDEDLLTLWHTCDVFVQPNIPLRGDMEGFGISVIEAAVCGIPVVAADLEGLKDAITDGKNGFRVPPQDPDAWVGKISEILSDDFDRIAFGKNASHYVITHNSWEIIAKRYHDTLQSLLTS